MRTWSKAGGLAALGEALGYGLGIGIMGTLLDPGNTQGWSAARKLAWILERRGLFQAWYLLVYVGGGLLLVLLVAALHENLKGRGSALLKVATPLGYVWAGHVLASGMVASTAFAPLARLQAQDPAQAATVWLTLGIVQDGLGGGLEIVGGLWVLLLSAAALRSDQLPRALNALGLGVGLAGLLSLVPPLREASTAAFGLTQVVWFGWMGLHLLTRPGDAPAGGSGAGTAGYTGPFGAAQ